MCFEAGVLVLLKGAAVGYCFRVLLLEWCARFGAGVRVTLLVQGAAAGCGCRVQYCQKAVCILGTWELLQGIAVRVRCAL